MFLTTDQIVTLTKRKRATDQAEWLALEGIPFQLRERRVLVLSSDVERWMHGEPALKRGGINWAAAAA